MVSQATATGDISACIGAADHDPYSPQAVVVSITLDVQGGAETSDPIEFGVRSVTTKLTDSPLPKTHDRGKNTMAVRNARSLLRLASLKTKMLNHSHIRDTAWNILLDLFVQEQAGSPTSVSSACIGSFAPPTTALRHIKVLVEEGAVQRCPDPDDNRRVHLVLNDSLRHQLVRILNRIELA